MCDIGHHRGLVRSIDDVLVLVSGQPVLHQLGVDRGCDDALAALGAHLQIWQDGREFTKEIGAAGKVPQVVDAGEERLNIVGRPAKVR